MMDMDCSIAKITNMIITFMNVHGKTGYPQVAIMLSQLLVKSGGIIQVLWMINIKPAAQGFKLMMMVQALKENTLMDNKMGMENSYFRMDNLSKGNTKIVLEKENTNYTRRKEG
ncbi:hypothetical protein FGO68_gene4228 [Halteria grandinella]|uniref:Uncharacterized protein n=1 Tax=Halteria grandinella TaxID=5974 RepID=A0A8J8T360_HALGN|nr:hypothetical protein FGO68_gene4228 [Halteria grandinella]